MKRLFFATLAFLQVSTGSAQNSVTLHANQIWYGYYPQYRFSSHWGLWCDMELQSKEHFVDNLSQWVFRLAATYYLNNKTKLTAGYAGANNYPDVNHLHVSQPEHAGWQQLQWFTFYNNKKLMQWIRLEEKFKRDIIDDYTLARTYTFFYRIRYNFLYQLPLSKRGIAPHTCSVSLGDEIYINFGKNITYNIFDQNRIFLGMSYTPNGHDNLVVGYMNLFQQLALGNYYRSYNVIRLSYFQNIDGRKKENEIRNID